MPPLDDGVHPNFSGSQYNKDTWGTGSDNNSLNGSTKQIHDSFYYRKAIIAAREDEHFGQLADTVHMPMHQGKRIEWNEYVPMLDKRNVNDQGIDAAGATLTPGSQSDYVDINGNNITDPHTGQPIYKQVPNTVYKRATQNDSGNYGEFETGATNQIPGVSADGVGAGNLYGSELDVGKLTNAFPALGENGGRANRIGLTRISRSSTIYNLGFFHDYNEDSINFDTDENMFSRKVDEILYGASRICEHYMQRDILNGGSTLLYPGTGITTRAGIGCEISYTGLGDLTVALDRNKTPMKFKMSTGSRMIDTKTVQNSRPLLVGPEVVKLFRTMVDNFGNPAFITTDKYAGSGITLMKGEVGQIDRFRVVLVNEMLCYKGAGANATGQDALKYSVTNGKFDVFPMICIGEDSFTNIGFKAAKTGDKVQNKFIIRQRKPGNNAVDPDDPFGKRGLISVQWWKGTMVQRPERIGLAYTIAPK